MQVTRIGWAGTRTGGYSAMVEFLTAALGLTLVHQEQDFAVLDLPSGDSFEVFGPSVQDNQYFTTGPVVGFVVEDLPAAVAELEEAGVELLGGQIDERGVGWRHFRAPTATSTNLAAVSDGKSPVRSDRRGQSTQPESTAAGFRCGVCW